MQKFIEERLPSIEISPERKKDKKSEVTEEERGQARGVCGSFNWLSKEGRPDAAGPSSLTDDHLSRTRLKYRRNSQSQSALVEKCKTSKSSQIYVGS